MEGLQKRLFNQTRTSFTRIKSYQVRQRFGFHKAKSKMFFTTNSMGFVTVFLCSFLSLMFTMLIGLSVLSTGIKNITSSQTHCIKQLYKTQNELAQVLNQLLALNKTVSTLNRTRKGVEASIRAALASVILISTVPALKTVKYGIVASQKLLILKQKQLLIKSAFIKTRALKEFKQRVKVLKVSELYETTFNKKALAVEKENIGKNAYKYKIKEGFKNHQKITFSWKSSPFYLLKEDLKWFLPKPQGTQNKTKQSCSVTLKQEGKQWQVQLYH